MRVLNYLLVHGVAFVAAAVVSSACKPPEYPATAFRCSPRDGADACPEGFFCCSDDPTAIDIDDIADFAVLPAYLGRGGTGSPIFSGGNNSLSISGMCIKEGAVPIEGALADVGAQGCPVPCNPTWDSADIEEVCGSNTICCQTVEIEVEDCVLDNDECWRPVTGNDISGIGTGLDATEWKGTQHATHQDPSGTKCKFFVAGIEPGQFADGDEPQDVEEACYRRLTVADQRGFCLGQSPTVTACPLSQAAYRDACEQRNDAEGKSCG